LGGKHSPSRPLTYEELERECTRLRIENRILRDQAFGNSNSHKKNKTALLYALLLALHLSRSRVRMLQVLGTMRKTLHEALLCSVRYQLQLRQVSRIEYQSEWERDCKIISGSRDSRVKLAREKIRFYVLLYHFLCSRLQNRLCNT
jgi:hypothetical protein